MVPKAGLEPARLSPLPPQDSVSTNSTTWAIIIVLVERGFSLLLPAMQFQPLSLSREWYYQLQFLQALARESEGQYHSLRCDFLPQQPNLHW